MQIAEYIANVSKRFSGGISTEHSYRADLQNLLESILSGITVTNEPTRIKCGAPDYVLTKKHIPVGYIEAKDIDSDLDHKHYQKQFERYKSSLDNLIITNYLEFQFYKYGVLVKTVNIGKIHSTKIEPITENFDLFINHIKEFSNHEGQLIKTASKLSKMMARKAKLLESVIENALTEDENVNANNTSLKDQLNAFQQILIHDITIKGFSDIYAQTITYGMFAARLHDTSNISFTRQKAAELIPKTNPFLRKLFQYIAGYDLDDRIKWIVDDLADIFRASDMKEILKNFGKATQQNDPIFDFYETFLTEYNPQLRKSRGVWYTPEPVVNFIVRAVDYILENEFGLKSGLADTSKISIKLNTQTPDKRSSSGYKQIEQEVHKVQILDPAAGTGTFLAEVIKQIYKKFENQQGIWDQYVDEHLIPRLNGFEILMASYAMAHLKLDLLLRTTGYISKSDQRFRVYLTNSLEEHHPDTGTLFASWLSAEANEANHIKRDTPVMVVLGNPPYSGISTNKGEWITNLIENYKYIDGEYFNERKHWLNDDYVKFIRFGQHLIDKNGEGILAFINNHSFLDNTTFRGMRWHLLNSFDTIYIIDLHGNSLKKEVCPDGSPDKCVFDIQAGVSINLFIKTNKKLKSELATVEHIDLWGSRESKYQALLENSLKSFNFKRVNYEKPFYFFRPKDNEGKRDFEKGFKIDELFPNNVTGIVTMGDNFILSESKDSLKERLNYFKVNEISEKWLNEKYSLGKNYAEWVLKNKSSIKIDDSKFTQISYRPFDNRWTYFDNKLIWRWRIETMQHFLGGGNVGLVIPKIFKEDRCVFISQNIIGHKLCSAYDSNSIFPLYLYPKNTKQLSHEQVPLRIPNLNNEIVEQIANKLGLTFSNEKENQKGIFAPIDILDYIYAVLYSPNYRKKYKEFLKIDFPRVPYPKNENIFWQLVKFGGKLREIHLLESPIIETFITTYSKSGSNKIEKIKYESGKVWINTQQYFDKVPQIAWEFFIGGYQPAQRWLKDRKENILTFEDIKHYQKIIVALVETDKLIQKINTVEIF